MSIDVRQSPEYVKYIESIGWQVEKISKGNVFVKKFPLIGSLIKIQRIDPPIPFEEIENLAKKHHAFQVIVEPSFPQSPQTPQPPLGYRLLKSPFIPTKTLTLDLKRTEKEIFASFSKNKRRDIRIAEKNHLVIKEGSPQDFVRLKKKTLWKKRILPLGTEREVLPLVKAFGGKSKILVVYPSEARQFGGAKEGLPLAGTLLLFHNKTAYYWQAAATNTGKKFMAPTLLLWEAIKLAKKKGCEVFDFEGVYDERFPKNKSWLGFTHFKKGFGGKEVFYPEPSVKNRLPFL